MKNWRSLEVEVMSFKEIENKAVVSAGSWCKVEVTGPDPYDWITTGNIWKYY